MLNSKLDEAVEMLKDVANDAGVTKEELKNLLEFSQLLTTYANA